MAKAGGRGLCRVLFILLFRVFKRSTFFLFLAKAFGRSLWSRFIFFYFYVLFLRSFSGVPGKLRQQSSSCRAHLACPEGSANNSLFGENRNTRSFRPSHLSKNHRTLLDRVGDCGGCPGTSASQSFSIVRRVFFPRALKATEFFVAVETFIVVDSRVFASSKIFRISKDRRDFLISGAPLQTLNFVSCVAVFFFFFQSRSR